MVDDHDRSRRSRVLLVAATSVFLLVFSLMLYSYFNKGAGVADLTLWDWLAVLIFPLALAVVGLVYQRMEIERDRARAEALEQREQVAVQERAQDVALQAYLDQMSNLIVDRGLRRRDKGLRLRRAQDHEDLRGIAQARTLAVLLELDAKRKRRPLKLVAQLQLINKGDPVIKLPNADFTGADLSESTFVDLDLSEVDLRCADLSGANLTGTLLTQADMREAILEKANLRGVDLRGADLRDARGLTQEQIGQARGDGRTQLPSGLERPESWTEGADGQTIA
jgi:hypothetical protein